MLLRRSVNSFSNFNKVFILRSNLISSKFSTESRDNDRDKEINNTDHPFRRTLKILKDDMKKIGNFFVSKKRILRNLIKENDNNTVNENKNTTEIKLKENTKNIKKYKPGEFPSHCDVLVIGGGGVGSSIAYWLKKISREGLSVVVVEKDSTYKNASTVLSVGGLRQQFSLPENIQMSLYGADFIRTIKSNLGEDVDVNFTPHGYLVLASESGAETLKRNSILQNELGARNELFTANKLKDKFPWLNTNGIVLGCHGLEKEGWFDPWALLYGLRRKAVEYGAHYVEGEVKGFEFINKSEFEIQGVPPGSYEALEKVNIHMADNKIRTIKFAICIIAAGSSSGKIARLARIGEGPGLLKCPLPVEPRKRYVYVFSCQGNNEPSLNTPLTIDPTNTYFRRDGLGGKYLCGRSPDFDKEPSIDNLDVDYDYFDTQVWPILAKRVPAFECLKVTGGWSGFYEYNTFDENGIIGPHPYYHNLFLATGFSGHGIQQAPAVGRAITELILDGHFRTIDLTRLGFDRIIVDHPMYEVNII